MFHNIFLWSKNIIQPTNLVLDLGFQNWEFFNKYFIWVPVKFCIENFFLLGIMNNFTQLSVGILFLKRLMDWLNDFVFAAKPVCPDSNPASHYLPNFWWNYLTQSNHVFLLKSPCQEHSESEFPFHKFRVQRADPDWPKNPETHNPMN